jgi:hypothetical protein
MKKWAKREKSSKGANFAIASQKKRSNERFSFGKNSQTDGRFAILKHLSRQKCATSIVLSLIGSRQVQLQELAMVFNHEVKEESNERRLQSFFKDCELDQDRVAFLWSVCSVFGKVNLCLDRTAWDFGKCQVNLFVLTAYC